MWSVVSSANMSKAADIIILEVLWQVNRYVERGSGRGRGREYSGS